MRAIWKGAISFGLVTIPVAVYPATEDKDLRFHQLHESDHGRIKYKRVCSKCGEEVAYEDIVKGYEVSKGRYVVLTPEELDAAAVESSHMVDIVQFVDLEEIDPVYFESHYYLAPGRGGEKAYGLLREALKESGIAAVGKVALREKERLAAIRRRGDVLMLETMRWPDEIREADFEGVRSRTSPRPEERKLAKTLVDSMKHEWEPERFKDEYRKTLLKIVDRKGDGEEIEAPETPERPQVASLMDALKKSVEATQSGKGRRRPSSGTKRRAKAS